MNRTILQIPMDTSLRNTAEDAATKAGFSSLQEVVRVFLNNFASQKVMISFHDYTLSPDAESRYKKMIDDVKKGKNIIDTNSSDELISILK